VCEHDAEVVQHSNVLVENGTLRRRQRRSGLYQCHCSLASIEVNDQFASNEWLTAEADLGFHEKLAIARMKPSAMRSSKREEDGCCPLRAQRHCLGFILIRCPALGHPGHE